MKRWVWIGLGIVGLGTVAVAAAAAAGPTETRHGVTWDTTACMPTHIDAITLNKWLEDNMSRIVVETNSRTGAEAVTAVMNALAPEGCPFPPPEGSPERAQWDLMLDQFDELYQEMVDAIWAAEEGLSMRLAYDPAIAVADALSRSLK